MSDIFPPEDYMITDSAVEGIEVYAPRPKESTPHLPIVDFKCPQCGATTAYDIPDKGLTCTHCGYYEPPKTPVVGKGAEEFEFTVDTMERSAHGWGEARREMACQNCGAHTSLPIGSLTYTCAFCGSNKVIQREAPQDLLRPRFLIPFKITIEKVSALVQDWLGSSWMTPAELKNLARKANFTGVYLPFWTFDSVTSANWRAEVGYTTTERYYDDGKWKTRMVTKWRWESGNERLRIDDLIVEGSTRLSRLLVGKMKDYNLNELTSYEPKYLAGLQARAYDLPLETAWERAREQMRERTKQACIEQSSTPQVRNFSMNLDFSNETWRYILLPVYIGNYSYQDKIFQVMVNGQTGTLAGQRPVDWTKVGLVAAAIAAPGLLICLLGLLTLIFGGIGMAIGGFGVILLIIGLVIDGVIVAKALSLDDV